MWTVPFFVILIGFLTQGPHAMIAGIMPVGLGTRKASSSVTGFVDSFRICWSLYDGSGNGWLLDYFQLERRLLFLTDSGNGYGWLDDIALEL